MELRVSSNNFSANNKNKVAFKGFKSLLAQDAIDGIVSAKFMKNVEKLSKQFKDDKVYDVLVFRDGKVVCAQVEFNPVFQAKNKLECDPQFAYENTTGDGQKLYERFSEKIKHLNEKYKHLINK